MLERAEKTVNLKVMYQKNTQEALEKILDYQFKNTTLLLTACTHASYLNEHKENHIVCNERLEFLGDAILNVLITEYIYVQKPKLPEGELSQLRATLISAKSCRQFAEKLNLFPFLRMGRGELLNREKLKTALMSDFFEALLGAIYLDGGLDAVKHFFFKNFSDDVKAALSSPQTNWKAALQELTQKTMHCTPTYHVLTETGPDHHKSFTIAVQVNNTTLGTGSGSSKKEAEQNAAYHALQQTKK